MRPPFLKANDKVAIVAPAGRVFEKELTENIQFLKSLQLVPVLGENLFKDHYNGYHYAGTPEERLSDFQKALDDDNINAIWCARGGYGCVHLIENLNWEKFKKNPKWIIGYSDITVFHNHINNMDIESLHGLTIKKLNTEYTSETFESLKIVLFGEKLSYKIPSNSFNKEGIAKGKLVGGNLSLIYSLSGTASALKGKNLILFIEDWCENWYHLDRMLMNLKMTGLLHKIKGMIVGSFTRMDVEEENPEFHLNYDSESNKIIHSFIKDLNIPVCFGFPAGHIGDNRAMRMGCEIELNCTKNHVTVEFI